jgi:protein TonB
MSAGAAPAPVTATAKVQRRRVVRHSVAVPVDLTVLRSGVPDSIPGRTVNVGENGVAAVIAAELRPGDLVGLEFRLPTVGTRLRAKAVVRHQERLHCGLEFLGLSTEQRAMIRYWAERGEQLPVASGQLPGPDGLETEANTTHPTLDTSTREPGRLRALRRALLIAVAAFVVIGGLGWWQWYTAWKELESRVTGSEVTSIQPAAQVPAAVMEQLVTHKVEPVYPASARQANVQGTVLLDTLIGPDGTVVNVHPLSGPEVLATAAVDAVRWWRFQPYQVNGQPTQVETTVAVEFRP